jgi:uncharacterized protein YecE (DUF72 family)
MEFGQGYFDWERDRYDFSNAFTSNNNPFQKLNLGLPQWGESAWKGSLYPSDCKTSDFLASYSKLLSCVEVSSTFYTEVSAEKIKSWSDQATYDFKFLPKWPRIISHDKGLINCQKEISYFVDAIRQFDEKLGVSFLQLPPSFTYDFKRQLFNFLCQVPEDFPLAIEFRHSSWFSKGRLLPRLEEFLTQRKISMVISDLPGNRGVFHTSFTGPHQIIRYLSDQFQENDETRLHSWKEWLDRRPNIGETSFVLHRPDNENAPKLIKSFDRELDQKIKESRQDKQLGLFE